MIYREQRVFLEHFGARIAHYLRDLSSHVGFVAMNLALRACALALAEWTLIEAFPSVIQQNITFRT